MQLRVLVEPVWWCCTLQLEMNALALSVVARVMQLDLNMLFKTRRASAPTLIAALKNDSKIE